MHEMGIVTHVAKTLDEMAPQYGITKYGSVTLQVGEVSGIVTDLFTDCWNYFRLKHPLLKDWKRMPVLSFRQYMAADRQ